jgi:putative ABC transport system substrate-binding protein
MRRRDFITLLGGAAAAWPIAARAQQAAMPVIGLLGPSSAEQDAPYVAAFRQGLQQAGYREGRNVAIEYRWAEGRNERLPTLVGELVRRKVNVIFALGPPAALAAKAAATTIPIVFVSGRDPVQLGLVDTLARPGGNATGVVTLSGELAPKRLELLQELLPKTIIFAALVNPSNATAEIQSKDVQSAASKLGLRLHVRHASSEREIETVFENLAELRIGALVILTDPFFLARSEQLAALALRHAVPSVFQYRMFAAAGGLMSYGTDIMELDRQAGLYAARILKGEKPADLPVQQATKVELIINVKTAKTLGLDVPPTLLGRADEVIE